MSPEGLSTDLARSPRRSRVPPASRGAHFREDYPEKDERQGKIKPFP